MPQYLHQRTVRFASWPGTRGPCAPEKKGENCLSPSDSGLPAAHLIVRFRGRVNLMNVKRPLCRQYCSNLVRPQMTNRWIWLSIIAISACDLGSAPVLSIEKVSGDPQDIQVGSKAALVVRVTEDGNPAARINVVWTSSPESGSVTRETDANGLSQIEWFAGPESAGLYIVRAALAARESTEVEFSLHVVPATSGESAGTTADLTPRGIRALAASGRGQ